MHLDAAYDSALTHDLLTWVGCQGAIACKGVPAPLQAGGWSSGRTSWMNGYGKRRRCSERDGQVVDFYLYLAAASSPSISSSSEPATATGGRPARRPSDWCDQLPGALSVFGGRGLTARPRAWLEASGFLIRKSLAARRRPNPMRFPADRDLSKVFRVDRHGVQAGADDVGRRLTTVASAKPLLFHSDD